jgi:hypothetical protein
MLGVLVVAVLVWWRTASHSQPTAPSTPSNQPTAAVEKMPIFFATHTFDPAAPPADMPPLGAGETAECDADFISNANVSGTSKRLDATQAVVTVTGARITLQLKINIWVPQGATQQVIEHEEGHRQISEYYYRSAQEVAEKVAAEYTGKQISVSGSDLGAEINAALQRIGAEITAEYGERLNPNAAQQRYDDLTDHSRNDISASDAVARVLQRNLANPTVE